MAYEPVGYILEYEICALLFLAVIIQRYFGARRFPNQKNLLFSIILWVMVADLILDVVGSLIIDNVFAAPISLAYVVNGTFYFLQILMPLLMTAYTLAMVGHLTPRRVLRLSPLLLPAATSLVSLISNPITHWFFYVDPVEGYMHGAMFIYTYLVCFFYMLVTCVIAFRHRASLRREEYTTIYRFLIVVLIAIVVQYLYPPALVTGLAMALAVVLMYFTIQNPETMLDATTGAFTYEAMLTFLQDRAQAGEHVQLMAVHIQNMTRINELLGIENGSLLLRQVSQFLRQRSGDIWVFRMWGSCFVAITRKAGDYETLRAGVEQRISNSWNVGGTEILVQAVVCCIDTASLFPEPITPDKAVSILETVLRQNDQTGKRITTIQADHALLDRVARAQAVETALRAAIETGQGLELYFQPVWSVQERRFTNAEVLLRFHHPTLGSVPPDEFVPIAESCGLVTAMDELVLRRTCAFIRDYDPAHTLGLEAIEVNLSALEFMQRRLPGLLRDIISQYQVDPGFIIFEITETAATESFQLLQECMEELRDTGCHFALDDFGTGYANITQVLQLPFSMAKLDKSLLYGSETVLEDVARMFARMQLQTVIEGVETPEQAARMQALQVDYIQGFHYARPMARQQLTDFLADNPKPPVCAVASGKNS